MGSRNCNKRMHWGYLCFVGFIIGISLSGCSRYSVKIIGKKAMPEPIASERQGPLPLVLDGVYYFESKTCNRFFFNTPAVRMCNPPNKAVIKSALSESRVFRDIEVYTPGATSSLSPDAAHMLITVKCGSGVGNRRYA